jgi:uncharacterized protein DUF6625
VHPGKYDERRAMKPWLIMLIGYFGRWPAWMNFFVESCKWNPDVCWRFYTDCGELENRADNVELVHVKFEDYKAFVRFRLRIAFDPADPYKVCDLRPCLGFLHDEEIASFPFFGFGDVDVVYGQISRFYNEQALAPFDVLSTHPNGLSGHFAVLRNTAVLREAFARVPNYRELLERPHYVGLDEGDFSRVFLNSDLARLLFVERYSTVLSPRRWHDGTMDYPQRWFWRDGRLRNERDGDRDFLYLHFMRWQSARWINNPPEPGEAAWVGRDIIRADWRSAAVAGFCVSPEGFTAIAP